MTADMLLWQCASMPLPVQVLARACLPGSLSNFAARCNAAITSMSSWPWNWEYTKNVNSSKRFRGTKSTEAASGCRPSTGVASPASAGASYWHDNYLMSVTPTLRDALGQPLWEGTLEGFCPRGADLGGAPQGGRPVGDRPGRPSWRDRPLEPNFLWAARI